MTADWLLLAGAGALAGSVNAAAGGGTLLSFPLLLLAGLSPLGANATSTVGLLVGQALSAWGMRAQLTAPGALAPRLLPFAFFGGLAGAALLLYLGDRVFAQVVPGLLLLASILLVTQNAIGTWLKARGRATASPSSSSPADAAGPGAHARRSTRDAWLVVATFVSAAYGGYFGAGAGIIFIAALGIAWTRDFTELYALKNAVAMLVNVVAAAWFVLLSATTDAGPVDFEAALPLAVGSAVGGWLGVRVMRRLPAPLLRGVTATVGIALAVVMVLRMQLAGANP